MYFTYLSRTKVAWITFNFSEVIKTSKQHTYIQYYFWRTLFRRVRTQKTKLILTHYIYQFGSKWNISLLSFYSQLCLLEPATVIDNIFLKKIFFSFYLVKTIKYFLNNVGTNDLEDLANKAKTFGDCTSKCTTNNAGDVDALLECTKGCGNGAFSTSFGTF